MKEPTLQRLFSKLLTLGILGACLWFALTAPPVYSATDCQACSETYYTDLLQCQRELQSCTLGEFECWLNNEICVTGARGTRDDCYYSCTFNSAPPGGGGGGPAEKSVCQQACYQWRIG